MGSLLDKFAIPSLTLSGKSPNEITIVVDGEEIKTQTSRVLRTMDTLADAFSAQIYWDPDNKDLVKLYTPYSYKSAAAYVGGELLVNGFLYDLEPSLSGSQLMNIFGFASTANIIDSSIDPPYQREKITLEDYANELIADSDIALKNEVADFKLLAALREPFERLAPNPTDKIGAYLVGLAKQKGVLFSSTVEGDLLLTEANATDFPVGTIEDNFPPGMAISAKFSGRARFNQYRAIGQRPKRSKHAINAIAIDDPIPESRRFTFSANETTAGNISRAADWQRSKQLAEALTIPYPVSSWYNPNGDLWRENTIVTVVSPTIFVPNGFEFLIRQVEFLSTATGSTAVLSLIPPQVYTGDPLVEPWL